MIKLKHYVKGLGEGRFCFYCIHLPLILSIVATATATSIIYQVSTIGLQVLIGEIMSNMRHSND